MQAYVYVFVCVCVFALVSNGWERTRTCGGEG